MLLSFETPPTFNCNDLPKHTLVATGCKVIEGISCTLTKVVLLLVEPQTLFTNTKYLPESEINALVMELKVELLVPIAAVEGSLYQK